MSEFLYIGPEFEPPWAKWPYPPSPWGSNGGGGRYFARTIERDGPIPNPWSVAFLVSVVSSKVAAENMTNKTPAQQIIPAADASITAFIDSDDICPPWPHPGPPPWLSIIASELTLVANTFQEGGLRSSLFQVAGQVSDRGQALSTVTATAGPVQGRILATQ
jgi:hypothetical protein